MSAASMNRQTSRSVAANCRGMCECQLLGHGAYPTSSTIAQPSSVSTSRSSASRQPMGVSRSISTTIIGVRNVATRPKLRRRPYGSPAASTAIGNSSHGPNGTAARMTAPSTAPAIVPMPRCTARANTEPLSGFTTMATVSTTQ